MRLSGTEGSSAFSASFQMTPRSMSADFLWEEMPCRGGKGCHPEVGGAGPCEPHEAQQDEKSNTLIGRIYNISKRDEWTESSPAEEGLGISEINSFRRYYREI